MRIQLILEFLLCLFLRNDDVLGWLLCALCAILYIFCETNFGNALLAFYIVPRIVAFILFIP